MEVQMDLKLAELKAVVKGLLLVEQLAEAMAELLVIGWDLKLVQKKVA